MNSESKKNNAVVSGESQAEKQIEFFGKPYLGKTKKHARIRYAVRRSSYVDFY